MGKRRSKKKPRSYTVTLDMGKPVAVDGMLYDPKSAQVSLLNNGTPLSTESAWSEQSYARKKGPKILSLAPLNPNAIFANPNRALEQFHEIYAVDTNTKILEEITVSVTGVVGGRNTKIDIPGHTAVRYRPLNCIEFHNVSARPENLGWREVIKGIMNSPRYSNRRRIAIVVDSDLGMIGSYNKREEPIFSDFYLPKNFILIYASSDSGSENIANQMIRKADEISSVILGGLAKSMTSEGLMDASDENYTHTRIWTLKT